MNFVFQSCSHFTVIHNNSSAAQRKEARERAKPWRVNLPPDDLIMTALNDRVHLKAAQGTRLKVPNSLVRRDSAAVTCSSGHGQNLILLKRLSEHTAQEGVLKLEISLKANGAPRSLSVQQSYSTSSPVRLNVSIGQNGDFLSPFGEKQLFFFGLVSGYSCIKIHWGAISSDRTPCKELLPALWLFKAEWPWLFWKKKVRAAL